MRDSERLNTIIQLININKFHDQKELKEALFQKGFDVTQATISRDLKALKIVKQQQKGAKSYYVIPEETRYKRIRKEHNEAEEMHWYVLYTRMFHEKKVAQRLTEKGIECWVPTQVVRKKWSDRIKIQEKLVISKIVFVHCTEQQRKTETFVPSTLAYLMDRERGEPAIVPDNQIETFQKVLAQDEVLVEFTEELLQPGQEVYVVQGVFAGMTAELQSVKNKNKVIVRINCLGTITLEIPLEYLQPKKSRN